jgi:hypothetical protein
MPGHKIGVEVGEKYMLDRESVFGSEGNVLIRVALWVNDGSRACSFVSNNVGGVRQARQIELFEDHAAAPPLRDG